MRGFNSIGLCVLRKHYMVDISDRVAHLRAMVERGDYFCVNRARQYGKTTTLAALRRALAGDFAVASLDFQALSHADFATESAFVGAFAREVLLRAGYGDVGYMLSFNFNRRKEPGMCRVAVGDKVLWEETV